MYFSYHCSTSNIIITLILIIHIKCPHRHRGNHIKSQLRLTRCSSTIREEVRTTKKEKEKTVTDKWLTHSPATVGSSPPNKQLKSSKCPLTLSKCLLAPRPGQCSSVLFVSEGARKHSCLVFVRAQHTGEQCPLRQRQHTGANARLQMCRQAVFSALTANTFLLYTENKSSEARKKDTLAERKHARSANSGSLTQWCC